MRYFLKVNRDGTVHLMQFVFAYRSVKDKQKPSSIIKLAYIKYYLPFRRLIEFTPHCSSCLELLGRTSLSSYDTIRKFVFPSRLQLRHDYLIQRLHEKITALNHI